MQIEFKRLTEVDKNEIIELLNHPLVLRHMPLATGTFDDKAYDAFIAEKEKLWKDHGYGPWAFYADGKFVGWGGLQYEQGDADFALVLHPDHWGLGKAIFKQVIDLAFGPMGLDSITALLPPTRTRIKGMVHHLHFVPDGEAIVHGERFLRFRLYRSNKPHLG